MIFNNMESLKYVGLKLLILAFLWSFLEACESKSVEGELHVTQNLMRHAQMVKAQQFEDGLLLEIHSPWTDKPVRYFLQNNDNKPDNNSEVYQAINRPVRSIIALSSTQWAPLLEIGKSDLVIGISEASFVNDSLMKLFLKTGKVSEVLKNGQLDFEKAVSLKPDIVLYSPDPTGASEQLERTGLQLFPWPDYLENSPLGRAEWIRVLGWLTGQEEITEKLFEDTEKEYLKLKALISDSLARPTIMADKAFNDQWYVPGGKSYMATIFKDAGAAYIWSENQATGSVPLDIETIISQAAEADFWRIAHASDSPYSYEKLRQENEIYAAFKAFRENKIIFCNTSKTAYFETSQFHPHLVLADFIAILHPELLPDHKPVYHHLLKPNPDVQ
jgi:iron complex transport system substrate-binding protein